MFTSSISKSEKQSQITDQGSLVYEFSYWLSSLIKSKRLLQSFSSQEQLELLVGIVDARFSIDSFLNKNTTG